MYKQLTTNELSLFPTLRIPVVGEKMNGYKGLQRLIMLDRYAMKDTLLVTLKKGDTVIMTIKPGKYPEVGYGEVIGITSDDNMVSVRLEFPDHRVGEIVARPKGDIQKPVELYWEQIADRVSNAMASVEETEETQHYWYKRFYKAISEEGLIPGGRIAYGAGNQGDLTLYNCYVLPMMQDSRQGIVKHAELITETMARGGGVGTNLSTLRPAKSPVFGINGFSSGSISWGGWLAELTHMINQGGGRHGAQMQMLADWHPDVIRFALCKIDKPNILAKVIESVDDPYIAAIGETFLVRDHEGNPQAVVNPKFMTGANISIWVSDDFMEAVKNDEEWHLRFPDIENFTPEQKQFYDNEWHKIGDVRKWEQMGYPTKTYHTLKAKDFYRLLMVCSYYSAEPGIVFGDRYNKESNSWYYDPIICTNPCGEQGLPGWGVCNLSAMNLSKVYDVDTNDINYELLAEYVETGMRFCDNTTDLNDYHNEENKKQSLRERRVGLGTMGLADLMVKMGLKYGSDEMLKVIDKLYGFIAKTAYLASSANAAEKGSFPEFDTELYLQSGFVKRLTTAFPEVEQSIREKGMRNVTAITMAPTGSTGTMVNVGTGIEPFFAFKYYRTGSLGEAVEMNTPIAEQYFIDHPEATELPDYFVSAQELTPEQHVYVQAAIQKWVDSSISKTINCPSHFTVEDTQQIYQLAYELGCKGTTIYVDGSRTEQVLSTKKKEENKTEDPPKLTVIHKINNSEEELTQDSTKACKITYDSTGSRIVECS